MLLHLVKKDFMLIKKQVLFIMLVVIVLPLFVLWRADILLGFPTFLLMTIYAEFILYQSVSVIEAKNPKAAGLLCSTSYSRSAFVRAKYIFTLFIFAYCYIAYSLIAIIVPEISSPDLFTLLTVFLITVGLFSIYIPFEFKLGFAKTKFFFIVTLLATSFGLPMLFGTNPKIDLSWLPTIPAIIQYLALSVISVLILAISMTVSIRIFNGKEL